MLYSQGPEGHTCSPGYRHRLIIARGPARRGELRNISEKKEAGDVGFGLVLGDLGECAEKSGSTDNSMTEYFKYIFKYTFFSVFSYDNDDKAVLFLPRFTAITGYPCLTSMLCESVCLKGEKHSSRVSGQLMVTQKLLVLGRTPDITGCFSLSNIIYNQICHER